jgi:hypothetical protein
MRFKLRRRSVWVIAASAAALVTAGGLAYATIPDSNGVIHGCYAKNTGALRVIDTGQACTSKETPLDWNQTGPQGAPGAPGASPVFGRIDTLPTSGEGLAYVTGVTSTLGTRVEREITWPNATFVARDLHVFVMTPPGEGNSWTFTFEVGGNDTPLGCTISGTAVSCDSGAATATIFAQPIGGFAVHVTATGSPPAAIATFAWRAAA